MSGISGTPPPMPYYHKRDGSICLRQIDTDESARVLKVLIESLGNVGTTGAFSQLDRIQSQLQSQLNTFRATHHSLNESRQNEGIERLNGVINKVEEALNQSQRAAFRRTPPTPPPTPRGPVAPRGETPATPPPTPRPLATQEPATPPSPPSEGPTT